MRSRPTAEQHLGVAPPVDHISDPAVEESAREDDAPEDGPRAGPLRRCIISQSHGERAEMLRFVVGPGDLIVPDLAARLPGRGIWLSARADVIHSPRIRQAFARAARKRVEVPGDLASRVEIGLAERIADLIGFARRAGQTVAGFQKAHEWLASGRAALIIQAMDGSAEERSRFIGGRTGVPVITPLPAAVLGRIFGREEAVHIAVSAGKLARALVADAGRLAGVTGREMAAPQSDGALSGVARRGLAQSGRALD